MKTAQEQMKGERKALQAEIKWKQEEIWEETWEEI